MSKSLIKNTLVVTVGVMLAGLVMYYGRDIGIIDNARNGFDV
jgi:hypothetical protein